MDATRRQAPHRTAPLGHRALRHGLRCGLRCGLSALAAMGILMAGAPPVAAQQRATPQPAAAAAAAEERVARLAGPDRLATAVAVARETFPDGAPAVVLARADQYPDALAGAPLAAGLGAPILLTPSDELAPAVAAEIRRLAPAQVVLLGGAAALGARVEQDVRAATAGRQVAVAVVRYAGADRFDTARLVAEAVLDGSGATEAYLTLGAHADPARGWPDAVALSGLAAAQRRPVLLTAENGLSPAVQELVRTRRLTRVTVVGGTAAVPERVLDPLRSLTALERLSGADRFATSAIVADRALDSGIVPSQVWLATGSGHADALAGGAAVAAAGGVLLLADGAAATQPALAFVRRNATRVDRVLILGGEAAIPQGIRTLLLELLGLAPLAGQALPAAGAGGVRVEVGSDLQAAVDAHPPGTRFLLAAGVHRGQSVRPRDGDSFVGERGTVLSGAKVLEPSSFAVDGAGRYVVDGQTQEASRSGGYGSTPWHAGNDHYAEPGSEAEVHYGEELFADGVRLRRVNSADEVSRPGTWYFDHDADRIVLFDDPQGRLIETSVTETAFLGEGTVAVTVENLTIRQYANRAQRGVLDATGSRGWVVRDVAVEDSHGAGLGVGDDMLVANSRVAGHGQIGLVGGGRGSTIRDSEITANRQLGFQLGWEAGGTKFTRSEGLRFTNNWVHHNRGIGVWFDIDNRAATITANLVEHNTTGGILWEISHDADIGYNELFDNHTSGDIDNMAGNIQIVASDGAEVHHNLVRGGGTQEIVLVDQDRGPGLRNTRVHDNDVTIATSWGGGTTGLKDQATTDPYAADAGNTFSGNTYRVHTGSHVTPFYWQGAVRTAQEWMAAQPGDTVTTTNAAGALPAGHAPFTPSHYGPR